MKRLFAVIGALVLFGAIAAGVLYVQWNNAVPIFAMAVNYVRYLSAPAGSMTTEVAASEGGAAPSAPASTAAASPGATPGPDEVQGAKEGDWPSYNKTLTSNRFSPLSLINKDNVGNLKVLCTYDTGQYTGFTSGLIEVNGTLIGTTEYDIFSIDPVNCRQNWRTHEDYSPGRRRASIAARLTWTANYFAAPRTAAFWLTISRRASASGRRRSPMRRKAKLHPLLRSPGTASSLSVMRGEH